MASRRTISIPTQARWLMPAAFIAAAAALGGCTSAGSPIAQPGLSDLCTNAILSNVGDGDPGNSPWNISNNNIAISSGGSSTIVQSGPGGTQSITGGNNQVTCCINGRNCTP